MAAIGRVLVTGATGFVGANLTRRLVADGDFEVHILTRPQSDRWRLSEVLFGVHDHVVDLLDWDALVRVVEDVRPSVIFHLATAGIYGGSHLPDRQLVDGNVMGTVNLLTACERVPYRCFVNTGSSSEYGIKAAPMREADICEPTTAYGVAKLAGTLYGSVIGKIRQRPVIGLRLFSPFGPLDHPARMVAHVVTRAVRNEPIDLGEPRGVRDYVYVEDVVDAYLCCLARAADLAGEIFNIGSGVETSVAEVVELVMKLTGSRSPINWHVIPPRPWDAPRWQADISRAARLLGWRPRRTIAEGLRRTVAWYQSTTRSANVGSA